MTADSGHGDGGRCIGEYLWGWITTVALLLLLLLLPVENPGGGLLLLFGRFYSSVL
jgi:hypothetical protein